MDRDGSCIDSEARRGFAEEVKEGSRGTSTRQTYRRGYTKLIYTPKPVLNPTTAVVGKPVRTEANPAEQLPERLL